MESKILDFTEMNGLVICNTPHVAENNAELLYINEAQKLGVDAVLFRRYFLDGHERPYKSEPAVCIFNKNSDFFNSKEHISLHAALWSSGRNEVYIIKSADRLDIINARKPAQLNFDGELSVEKILLASSEAVTGIIERQFSAYLFCNGTFWEQPEFANRLDEKSSPYIYLLDYLMSVRNTFFSYSNLQLHPETIDKLLVTSILIKFLEEITDDKGKHTLRSIYKKFKINSFAEAVEAGYCMTILTELANEFNGKIFDKFSDIEKNNIVASDLTILANFLRANIDVKTNQMFLWEQYSFKHLPAEVISAIYENFIQAEAIRNTGEKEKGVVYTPIHLVNLLIDEVMPLDKPELFLSNSFKVIDPSCGSGVFLVAAFKRLLQWWAINNSSPGNIQYPGSKVAQKILEDNIFGVDVKRTATLVSVFSLTTALLDKLTPQEIWNNLKFKDLSQKNIQHNSFFDWALLAKIENRKFDLVIGNPPFNVETGRRKDEVLTKNILTELNLKHKNIPNNNFALHFFETAMLFSEKVCLIIPSSALLYSRSSQNYRNQIFTNYTVNKIFDFTHLREVLFTKRGNKNNGKKTGRTPVVAVIVENKPSEGKFIEHIVVKRTVSTENKIRFEIDYYDSHRIKLDWAVDPNKYFIWKANLLGGGRLFQLIYRLSLLETLSDFISKKKEEDASWLYSSGYKVGGNTKKYLAQFVSEGDKIEKVFEDGKYSVSASGEATNMFEFFPNENIYIPPFLVFDQVIGKNRIPVSFVKNYSNKRYLYFNRDFVGISASQDNLKDLESIYLFFTKKYNSLYRLYVLVQSGSSLVLTETEINKRDIDVLPYPENENYLLLSEAELFIQQDVLNYYIHLGKAISFKSDGYLLHQKVNESQLLEYSATFCSSLNDIYSKSGKSWQTGTIYQTDLYTVCQFGFGVQDGLSYQFNDLSNDVIAALVENELSNSGTIYKRVVRMYKHLNGYDCVFFIKPNALLYWLNSIALRDADDTYFDLKQAGF
jgi:hypothetical protein